MLDCLCISVTTASDIGINENSTCYRKGHFTDLGPEAQAGKIQHSRIDHHRANCWRWRCQVLLRGESPRDRREKSNASHDKIISILWVARRSITHSTRQTHFNSKPQRNIRWNRSFIRYAKLQQSTTLKMKTSKKSVISAPIRHPTRKEHKRLSLEARNRQTFLPRKNVRMTLNQATLPVFLFLAWRKLLEKSVFRGNKNQPKLRRKESSKRLQLAHYESALGSCCCALWALAGLA